MPFPRDTLRPERDSPSTRAEGEVRYMTLRREDLETRFPGVLGTILAATPPPA
ncbi:hypothetical protein [Bailinhaonella thermotolerans]|uniref:hypothetical protein n=1 Tax=Bailinhaonella thermotolerans TaxID=1070861 RepID=UPI00192A409B|nr:hypothetical protein [Bailinhaonella thermotolerans]